MVKLSRNSNQVLRKNKKNTGQSPLPIVFGQHMSCEVENLRPLRNALFVLHTTSSKFSPPARWPSRLNQSTPRAPHCLLHLLMSGISLPTSRCRTTFAFSSDVQENTSPSGVFSSFFSPKAPKYLAWRGKCTKGGRGARKTRLTWPGCRVKMSLKLAEISTFSSR